MSTNDHAPFYETFAVKQPAKEIDLDDPTSLASALVQISRAMQTLASEVFDLKQQVNELNCPDDNPVLTVDEAAEMLRISKRSVWELIALDDLRVIRLSKRVTRIPRASIDAFLMRCNLAGRSI